MGSYKLAAFLLISFSGYSQTFNRYFVSFKDKNQTPYSISNPAQFLSAKSIARRARENFATTSEDLPVDPTYVAQVKATGASVFFTSRWFNGVLVQMDETLIPSVASLPFVSKVELVAHGKKLLGGRKAAVESSSTTSTVSNQFQLQMIGLDEMHNAGYLGEGIDVAVFDAGFIGTNTTAPFQHLFTTGRIKDVKNFVKNTSDVYSDYDHGTEVLSVMAAYQAGVYEGGAYQANYFLYETEDVYSEYRIEEYNWAFAAERADSAGVDVINSSLGYNTFDDPAMDYTYADMNGRTSVIARAARKAFERGILVVVAGGNEGGNAWKYITTPADADGVIASGSVDFNSNRSGFSSIGYSSDGRVKPDVCALGSGASIILYNGSLGSASGTSLACPLIASLVVGLRQVIPNASAREIYKLVINSASQAYLPDAYRGFGIPDFSRARELASIPSPWVVFPNPVEDEVRIFFSHPDGQPVRIEFFSSLGQEMATFQLPVTWNVNPIVIPLSSSLPSGVYFVKVSTFSNTTTVKILKR
jgi:hypothetical protein